MKKLWILVLGLGVAGLAGCSQQISIVGGEEVGSGDVVVSGDTQKVSNRGNKTQDEIDELKKHISICEEHDTVPIKNIRKLSNEVYDCKTVATKIIKREEFNVGENLFYTNNIISELVNSDNIDNLLNSRTDIICQGGRGIGVYYFNILSGSTYKEYFQELGYSMEEFKNFVNFLNTIGPKLSGKIYTVYSLFYGPGLANYEKNGIYYTPHKKPIIVGKHKIFSFHHRGFQGTKEVGENIIYIDGKLYSIEEKINNEMIQWEIIGLEDNILTLAYARNKQGLFLEHEDGYYNADVPLEEATFSREAPHDYNPDFPPIWHEYDIRECKLKI